jgi:hypothetical protein
VIGRVYVHFTGHKSGRIIAQRFAAAGNSPGRDEHLGGTMKRLFFLLIIAALAVPLSAGVTYNFSSVTDGRGGTQMSGVTSIEGTNMRLDFTRGDRMIFKDGSVVLSRDGGKTLLVLDPKQKSYFELDLEEVFGSLGNAMKSMGGVVQFSIRNQKVQVSPGTSGGTIEGYATTKYRVDSTYEMTMKVMGMGSTSNIHSVTETWTTDKLGSELITFVQMKGLRTGMEDLDKLLASQTKGVKGFPLKQVTTTTTTSGKKSQTNTTTVMITDIRNAKIDLAKFEVPKGYKKEESPLAALQPK